MTDQLVGKRVEEGSLITPDEDVRILAAVTYDDHMSLTGESGEVLSFVCDTHLWLDDENVEKDTTRLLGLISDDHPDRVIDLRYARMCLDHYAVLLDFRRDMELFTDAEMILRTRRAFFVLIKPHFETSLRLPWLSSDVVVRSHPTLDFNLSVRHIGGGGG